MRKLFFIVIISILSFVSLYCQSEKGKTLNVISTAGSSIEAESLVISWTVGDNIIDFLQIQESIGPKPEDRPGVMKMNDGTLLKVYPTLTKGPLTIKIRKITEGGLTAEFLDMEGKKLKVIKLNSDQVDVDLSNFQHGMYLVKIFNENYTDQKVVKIVKH